MQSPAKGIETVIISAQVPPAVRDALRTWGNGNLSEGLRKAITEPDTSPSGARWITDLIQLPPGKNPGPVILAMPGGIVAHGIGETSLLIDAENSRLQFMADAGGVTGELNLCHLSMLATNLPAAVVKCCDPAANTCRIGPLNVSRLVDGLVELRPAESPRYCGLVLPIRHGLQLAAEVVGLLARRVEQQQNAVAELNATLLAPASPEPDAM